MRARRLSLAVLLALALVAGLAGRAVPVARAAEACAPGERFFPETQFCVSALFAAYWDSHGGLPQQGYPVSKAFAERTADGKATLTVQYFQRARFELHTEPGKPDFVLLGLLGSEQFEPKYPTKPAPMAGDPFPGYGGSRACEPFALTGFEVCGPFLAYWLAHGDLAQQGYPISPVFLETNPTDQQQYPTQYFQRARFEYHEKYLPTDRVQLGLLGDEQYKAKGGGQPAPSASPSPAPGNPVILRDDFTDPQSGWPSGKSAKGEAEIGYANGGYRIGIAAANYGVLPTNQKLGAVGNVRIEVDGVKVAGPNDAPFGLQCRVKNTDNLYVALHDGDGYAAIYRIQEGTPTALATTGKGPSPAFKTGNATNRLRFDCVGGALTFYANGQKVLEAQDATFASGRIGFAGFTGKAGGLDIVFRALVVSAPGGGQPAPSATPAPSAAPTSDEALMVNAARLVEGAGGGQIVRTLVERDVRWTFATLNGSYGSYNSRTNLITYHAMFRTMDPHDLGAVLGHEGTHAYDYFTSGPVRTGQECYNREARGFAASAALWKAWYGSVGKASPANDFEREMNRILDLIQADPERLAAIIIEAYKDQCEALLALEAPDPRPGPGVPASLAGLPPMIGETLPGAQVFLGYVGAGATPGPGERVDDAAGLLGGWR